MWAAVSFLYSKKQGAAVSGAIEYVIFQTDMVWVDAPLVPATMRCIVLPKHMWYMPLANMLTVHNPMSIGFELLSISVEGDLDVT